MMPSENTGALAASITRAGSMQTYLTIQLLTDRDRSADAYRAYAYFRWVDDRLDAPGGSLEGRLAFLQRQQALLGDCYRGETPVDLLPEERILAELVRHNPDPRSGLHTYLRQMMMVMAFDTERRGRLISSSELDEYTRFLASAVTEALHFFIGHGCRSPQDGTRYLAVSAAHVTHMLRDTFDDLRAGYYNIPLEVLTDHSLRPEDVGAPAYRAWVKNRVDLARRYFEQGKDCFMRVQNPRCRLAGLSYAARFESLLGLIEKDGYLLREKYPELNPISAMGKALIALAGGTIARRAYPAESEQYLRTE